MFTAHLSEFEAGEVLLSEVLKTLALYDCAQTSFAPLPSSNRARTTQSTIRFGLTGILAYAALAFVRTLALAGTLAHLSFLFACLLFMCLPAYLRMPLLRRAQKKDRTNTPRLCFNSLCAFAQSFYVVFGIIGGMPCLNPHKECFAEL